MTLDELVVKLQDKNLTVVSKRSGVEYQRLLRIARGKARRPLIEDVEKIKEYLENN